VPKPVLAPNPERVYWDSSTYIDYLTGEHKLREPMEMVIEDWRAGLVTMVTSALTIAEVFFVRVNDHVIRDRDADIEAIFNPPPSARLILVELNRVTALRARDLARNAISPKDSVHVASALEANCPLMHTTDSRVWDKSEKVGGTPPLRIEPPSWQRQLTAFEPSPSEPQPPSGLSPDAAQD
jgi:predicted nucleic acid-binding protein